MEKEFVTCCGAEEISSALFYIYLLSWTQTHPGSAQKSWEVWAWGMKRPHLYQSAIGGSCLLRTSTGGAQG